MEQQRSQHISFFCATVGSLGLLLLCLGTARAQVLPTDTLEIRSWVHQGDEALGAGQYPLALEHYFRAMDRMEALNWPDAYLECFYSVAYCYQAQGRLQELLSLEPRVQAYLQRKDDPYLPDVLLALGNTYRHNQQLRKALQFNEKAIALAPEGDPDYWLTLADAHNNQGILFRLLGETDQALLHYQEALRFFVKEGATDKIAQILHNLGLLHKVKKEYDLAIRYFQQALDSLPPSQVGQSSLYANIHDAWGNTLVETGQPLAARTHYLTALKNLPEGHFFRGNVYRHLGKSWLASGDPGQARQWLERALQFREEIYPLQHTHKALSYRDLGDLALGRQDTPEALAYYQQSIRQLVRHWEPRSLTDLPPLAGLLSAPELVQSLRAKAGAWAWQGKALADSMAYRHSLETYLLAIQLVDSLRANYWGEESKLLLAESATPLYEATVDLALRLYEQSHARSYLYLAYRLSATHKAAILREQIRAEQALDQAQVPDSLIWAEKELRYLLNYCEQILLEHPDSTSIQTQRFGYYQAHLEVLATLAARFPSYTQAKNETFFSDPGQIQAQLSPGSLLVEFFWGRENLHIFALYPQGIHHHSLAVDSVFLQELIAFIAPFSQVEIAEASRSKDAKVFQRNGFLWYQRLLQPVRQSFGQDFGHLILVPDGVLGYLPFESLCTDTVWAPDFGRLPYLFQQIETQYLYAVELLSYDASSPAGQTFAGFAPSFGGQVGARNRTRGDQSLTGVLQNQTVVTTMSERWQGQAYLGGEATKARFLQEAGDYQILHLGTHGFTDEANPAGSGLYFQHEEILYAYEIYHQRLQAQLAVLSACETGSGRLLTGEGIYSLARAFTAAGCKSIVMSLWKVDDHSTRDLMLELYAGLDEGLTTAKALQQARQQFLQTHDQVHPYYWSAFVLIGQDQVVKPSPQDHFSLYWGGLLGGILVLLFVVWYLRTKFKA